MDELKNSCRLCFNIGEIDLFKHKVIIDGINDATENEEYERYELDAVDLWKIYQDEDLLNLSAELKLICQPCLEELINCYKFFLKIRRISTQKQHLFEEAQKLQTEQIDYFEFEALESEVSSNVSESNLEKTFEETPDATNVLSSIETDSNSQNNDSTHTATPVIKNEIDFSSQNQTSVDADDVEQYVVEELDSPPEDESINIINNNIIYQSDHEQIDEKDKTKPPALKRPRLKLVREKLTGHSGPAQPLHADAALVVTQFLPIKAKRSSNAQLLENEFTSFENFAQQNTVEYTAVEMKGSNLQHLDNGDLQLENNDNHCDSVTNKEVFFCQYCPKAFSAASYLIAHVRKSHVCKYCTKAFVKSLDLYVHIREAHYQPKCAICHKELSSQSNLRGHIKRVHGIRLPSQVALLDYKL